MDIFALIGMVECTGGAMSFSRNICADKKSFYSPIFPHYTWTYDLAAVHAMWDSKKYVLKSNPNFEALSPWSARVTKNLRQGEPSNLYFTELEIKYVDNEGQSYFWYLQGAADFSTTGSKTGKQRDHKIRCANQLKPTV